MIGDTGTVPAIRPAAVRALHDRVIGPEHKALPPVAWGRTVREYLATTPHLDELQTPVLTIDRGALDNNLAVMAEWVGAAGVRLAPHGKTTMSPQLWGEQLAAGAWGVTLATGWQAQVARRFGVRRILIANTLVDPVGLAWAAAELADDPSFDLLCWADDVVTVEAMDRHLAGAPAGVRVSVLVELGGPRGRTGARSVAAALEVAAAIERSAHLELAGVGGYEGPFARDRSPAGLAAVRGYLDELARLHGELRGRYPRRAIVTAGGSAFPDLAAERLARTAADAEVPTTVVLRSGAYLIHDDGFYAGLSPLIAGRTERPLRSAMHGWARTVSRPEPELALLDAGKRDLPYDEGMPVPQSVSGSGAVTAERIAGTMSAAAHVSKLNDQHTFLRLPGGGDVPIGSVVRLGLSHPCTAFDKWRLIPVIDDADAERPRVVDFLHTFF
ncbi:type III PLP-dependent enzyme domain-containing protein [Nocardia aurantia]|uniref:D-threonine aldolase n=1 Tax=Nocardia aurantia TaxID=2585199 RepID=A0A7K0DZ84_9NOCA|nr:amino acid deaminase [Nocardia aurantia]MQY30868.1 D-threonine aldolase [Nocardia aurantia]